MAITRQAVWNNVVLAESDDLVNIENNYYFPRSSLNTKYFTPSGTRTTCPWKGQASYFTIEVDGQTNRDAAWYYPDPKPAAEKIKDRVAFWKGVSVREKENA